LVDIPAERCTALSAERRLPKAGDNVVLDQGFTGSNGEPMVIVYFPNVGESLYEAEVFESELK
jgi:hypothetical protein